MKNKSKNKLLIVQNKLIVFFLLIFVVLFGCARKKEFLIDQIIVGQTKAEIVQLIGDTSEKRYISKRNNQIQGPEKEFWHEIPMDTKLEVWTYSFETGKLNLYFLGKSSELKYKTFYPRKVEK